jgi:hypothetical protein
MHGRASKTIYTSATTAAANKPQSEAPGYSHTHRIYTDSHFASTVVYDIFFSHSFNSKDEK